MLVLSNLRVKVATSTDKLQKISGTPVDSLIGSRKLEAKVRQDSLRGTGAIYGSV